MVDKLLKIAINSTGQKIYTSGLTLNQNSTNNVLQLVTVGFYPSITATFKLTDGSLSDAYHMNMIGEYQLQETDSEYSALTDNVNNLYLYELQIPYKITSVNLLGSAARINVAIAGYAYDSNNFLKQAMAANSSITINQASQADTLDQSYSANDVEALWRAVGANTKAINDQTELPPIVNDKFLHTTDAGILEWSNVVMTKDDVGLGNVDNTSDVNKPVSVYQQEALNLKQDAIEGPQLDALESGVTSQKVQQIDANVQSISDINAKMMAGTNDTDNQLANKSFVNSSIQNMAARFITKDPAGNIFATRHQLMSATEFYYNGFTTELTNNDYTVVSEDENHQDLQARYIYIKNGDRGAWTFQYTVGSAFTAAQTAAINSGITSDKVAAYDDYATSKQDKLVASENIKTINGQSILGSGNIFIQGGSGQAVWGNIQGSLSQQEDLAAALSTKVSSGQMNVALSGKQDTLSDTQLANIADIPNKADKDNVYEIPLMPYFMSDRIIPVLIKDNSTAKGYYQHYEYVTVGATEVLPSIPKRDGLGNLEVPIIPTQGKHAASKSYVDAAKQDVVTAINDIRANANAALSGVGAINNKIPADATSANQLADKQFVNDSIQEMAANYVTSSTEGTSFATKAALLAGPYYHDGQSYTLTRNDYAVVDADEDHNNSPARYLYTGSQWAFQYIFSDVQLSPAQMAALNSGITAGKVTIYDGYDAAISEKADTVDIEDGTIIAMNAEYAVTADNYSESGNIATALAGKQDALPSVTNGYYLHANASTGALEWSAVNSAVWGNITGQISNQADLKSILDGKQNTQYVYVLGPDD